MSVKDPREIRDVFGSEFSCVGAPSRKHLQKFKNLVADIEPNVLKGFRKDDIYML